MKHKISTNFVPYTDAGFLQKATSIVSSMQNNPVFSDPVPPLAVIQQLLSDYESALQEATTKNINAIALKNSLRKQLERQLSRLALYVMYIADDDESILVSSGYSLTKKPETDKLEEPGQPVLSTGITSGQMISIIKAVKGAKYYLHEITCGPVTPSSLWESHTSSRRKYTYNDLTPGQQYWVRITVCGSGHQKAVSALAYQWAQ